MIFRSRFFSKIKKKYPMLNVSFSIRFFLLQKTEYKSLFSAHKKAKNSKKPPLLVLSNNWSVLLLFLFVVTGGKLSLPTIKIVLIVLLLYLLLIEKMRKSVLGISFSYWKSWKTNLVINIYHCQAFFVLRKTWNKYTIWRKMERFSFEKILFFLSLPFYEEKSRDFLMSRTWNIRIFRLIWLQKAAYEKRFPAYAKFSTANFKNENMKVNNNYNCIKAFLVFFVNHWN